MTVPDTSAAGGPPAAAPPGPVDLRVSNLLDPVADLLRGAFPYHGAAAGLPEGQPVPSQRIRRRVDAPGLRVAIERYRDDARVATDELPVTRLPLDRAIAPPRRRVHPMPATHLRLADAAAPAAAPAEVTPAAVPADATRADDARIVLPPEGPTREDRAAVLRVAAAHRLVVVEGRPAGDPALLAGLLLQLVAAGTPCWCSAEVAQRLELLGPQLRALLTFDPAEVDDELGLASRTARQKRAAWVEHDLELRWGPDADGVWAPALRPTGPPPVSVVMPSRRPGAVRLALGMMAAQTGVELEVVVALHGAGDPAAVDAERRRLGLEGRVLSVPAEVPFGAAINHAIAHTSAPVVLKWDDDDLYGPRHVQDLLVARRQSGAALVGKAAEFVYFERSGTCVWRSPGRAEAESVGMAGGTLMTDRAALDEVGGYPDVAFAEDHHLKLRLRERGMHPFRTHGFGFVLRRHGHGHAWEASDEQLAARAVETFDGLPDVLELGEAARATRLPET